MERIFIVLFILFLSYSNAWCDYTYSSEFDAYYKYVDKKYVMAWSNFYCSHEGSKLFFPESEKEAQFAFELVPESISQIWIGVGNGPFDYNYTLHDVEGGNADYLRTFPKLQNITKPWLSVAMNNATDYDFVDPLTNLPFICRKSKKYQEFNDDRLVQLIRNQYVYKKYFNALYKHNKREYFYEIELLLCNFDGGTTFFPESKEEYLVPREMNIKGLIHIGYTKIFDSDFQNFEGPNLNIANNQWGPTKQFPEDYGDFIVIDILDKHYTSDKYGMYDFICKIKLPEKNSIKTETCIECNNLLTNVQSKISLPTIHAESQFFEPLTTVILLDGQPFEVQFRTKNYKYINKFQSFYKVYDKEALSQWTAALICSTEGSDLFYPESKEEAEDIFEFIPKNMDKLWTGLMPGSSKKIYTFTGELVTNLNINNTKDFQNRGIILHRDLHYENADYKEQLKFLCKKYIGERYSYTGMHKGNYMTYGYSYRSEFGAWYKYYDIAETFEFAFIQCLIDGATLFVPDTKSELEEMIRDMEILNPIWLGLTKYLRNYFVTVKGLLASDYYSKWNHGQPNLYFHYVATTKNGKYFTTHKYDKYSFICKKINPEKKMSR